MVLFLALGIWYWNCLPEKLFPTPYSTVLKSKEGKVLGGRIAKDGQWRFPIIDTIPFRFKAAIIEFEDRNFEDHIGISFRGIARAFWQNLKEKKVVSGGSTITMQLIRMSRGNKSRNLWQKLIEVIQATRLEIKFTKDEILKLYTSHAPMGGNVIGLETASWRYFNRAPENLSWGETSLLAVLPNAPSLLHPGRNRDALLKKRNRLLYRLYSSGKIDFETYELAVLEPIPLKPSPLPNRTGHFLEWMISQKKDQQIIQSSIDQSIQNRAFDIVQMHHLRLAQNEIHNAAAIILDVEKNEIIAYVGNTYDQFNENENYVDIIHAPRSTGSILKPFLYASMLNDGNITPKSLIKDIPTYLSGYSPKNYTRAYQGVVPADKALARSLNVPAVRMLSKYGVHNFINSLSNIGLTTIDQSSDYYGLTLILGGAEASLWELCNSYASMARVLNSYPYPNANTLSVASGITSTQKDTSRISLQALPLSPSSIWETFKAMIEVTRPENYQNWEHYANGFPVAWKTGTSYGFRDAWAIGVSKKYVVGVWTGNADGEGRPGIVGYQSSAPILFDLFSILEKKEWFSQPYDDMTLVTICKESGQLAGTHCPNKSESLLPSSSSKSQVCDFHRIIHLDSTKQYQVNSKCYPIHSAYSESRFIIPTQAEWFYKRMHPEYISPPEFGEKCKVEINQKVMSLIYPRRDSKIYIPREFDLEKSKSVFEVIHRIPSTIIHWHIDHVYIGATQDRHNIEVSPEPGEHLLTLTDEKGNTLTRKFLVFEK